MNEIGGDIGEQYLGAEFGWPGIAAIHSDSAGGCQVAGGIFFAAWHAGVALPREPCRVDDSPGFRRAAAEDRQLIAAGGDVVERAAGVEVGVATEVFERQQDVLYGIANIADEAIALVIGGIAEASSAGQQLEVVRWSEG